MGFHVDQPPRARNRRQDLSHRLKRGAYRAKPVRRVYIPKADGRQRPLGVPALEDKIVQRAAVEVLNAIYETDFLGFNLYFIGIVKVEAWGREGTQLEKRAMNPMRHGRGVHAAVNNRRKVGLSEP
jgi:hypothetical protein